VYSSSLLSAVAAGQTLPFPRRKRVRGKKKKGGGREEKGEGGVIDCDNYFKLDIVTGKEGEKKKRGGRE